MNDKDRLDALTPGITKLFREPEPKYVFTETTADMSDEPVPEQDEAVVESAKPKVQPKDRFKTPYGKREVKKPLKIGSDLLSKLVPRKPARFS